jgi:hypothetical protein
MRELYYGCGILQVQAANSAVYYQFSSCGPSPSLIRMCHSCMICKLNIHSLPAAGMFEATLLVALVHAK